MTKEIKDKISGYIDENKNWLIDSIFTVVSQNTINLPPGGNENNGQDVIENIFRQMRLETDRFSPDDIPELKDSPFYLKGRNYKNRDNIIGSTGQNRGFTLIFNGHIDTVPSNNFNWSLSGPFEPKLIDDRIYGLGACDMKAGLITSIFALKTIKDIGLKIKGRVIIESVVDEEFGGANGSLACVLKGYTGDLAVIAEPTSMDVCISSVCSKVLLLKVTGAEGLNYFQKNFNSINPIILMSSLLLAIKDYETYLNSLKKKYAVYRNIPKPFNFQFSDIIAGEIGPDKVMKAPGQCLARIYTMDYPDINNEEFDSRLISFLNKYPHIRRALNEKIIQIEDGSRFIEGGQLNLKDKNIKAIIDNIEKNAKSLAGRSLKTSAALGGTDFFAFNNYGNTPCIVLGPGGGNLHSANEYVELNDLLDLAKIFAALIYDFCC